MRGERYEVSFIRKEQTYRDRRRTLMHKTPFVLVDENDVPLTPVASVARALRSRGSGRAAARAGSDVQGDRGAARHLGEDGGHAPREHPAQARRRQHRQALPHRGEARGGDAVNRSGTSSVFTRHDADPRAVVGRCRRVLRDATPAVSRQTSVNRNTRSTVSCRMYGKDYERARAETSSRHSHLLYWPNGARCSMKEDVTSE
jgi:hypothetical protein